MSHIFSTDQEHIEDISNELIIKKPVQLLDLFPTLVKLTGLGPPLQNCNKSLQKLEKLCTDGGKSIFDGGKNDEENLAFLQYPRLCQYGLSIFQGKDTKLDRFWRQNTT